MHKSPGGLVVGVSDWYSEDQRSIPAWLRTQIVFFTHSIQLVSIYNLAGVCSKIDSENG